MALHFYNSLTRKLDEFIPLQPGRAGLYTCGPTVYNFPHIGNYRAYIFEDLLRRTLQYCGFQVTQVMNLTDVDDKTIRDSRQAGVTLDQFTRRYKDAFFADLETLRIEKAEYYPAATEHIPEMITLVQTLMDKGIAYQAEDDSVYFSIARYPRYGCLVNLDPTQLRSSGRVSNDEYAKESVADFALWKAHEPADGDVWWDSPWGRGRPGWHLECSAMSMKYLGPTFDIHTGGIDNMFPHHEDEIAQSEAATGQKFVRYWLHCAHLIVDGQKMSKSLGNFHTLADLLKQGLSGREIRYTLLGCHYRQPLNFTLQGGLDARSALQRLDDFNARLQEAADSNRNRIESAPGADLLTRAENDFRRALEDDLNIAAALAALFQLVRDFNRRLDTDAAAAGRAAQALNLLRRFDTVLGVLDIDREEPIPAAIENLAQERQQARRNRDFNRADMIRDQLARQGWVVEDTPAGPRLKKTDGKA